MASVFRSGSNSDLLLKPFMGVQLLPRCTKCGDRHPLAYKPKKPDGVCPKCGTLLADLPPEQDVPAVITGWSPSAIMVRVCYAIGQSLVNLWKSRQ